MAFLDKHVGSNERIIYRCRPSRRAFLMEYIAFFVALIINLIIIYPIIFGELNRATSAVIKTVGYIFGIITLIILIRVEYKIWSRRYALTDQRLMTSEGIFSENFKSSVYYKVTDIGLRQSFFDKILNTGTIFINTAGSDGVELLLDRIANPFFVKKNISDMQAEAHARNTHHQGQHLNNHHPKKH